MARAPSRSATWKRAPAYLVAATSARDVSKAVRFAARYNLRLRIKNTGHDYLGRSGAEGSFTISTHLLKDAEVVRGWKPDCKKYKHSCRHAVPQDAIVAGPALYVEDLYTKAKENNVVIPGGVSRTVGATGGEARSTRKLHSASSGIYLASRRC